MASAKRVFCTEQYRRWREHVQQRIKVSQVSRELSFYEVPIKVRTQREASPGEAYRSGAREKQLGGGDLSARGSKARKSCPVYAGGTCRLYGYRIKCETEQWLLRKGEHII